MSTSEASPAVVSQRPFRERRRHARVPFEGTMCWETDRDHGEGEVIDLSPGGVAFHVPQRDAVRLRGQLALDMALGPGLRWRVADAARIVRIVPRDMETCRVCVQFAPFDD